MGLILKIAAGLLLAYFVKAILEIIIDFLVDKFSDDNSDEPIVIGVDIKRTED